MNEFKEYSDEQLNRMATEFILGECWHSFPSCSFSKGIGFCDKCSQCQNTALPNANFTQNLNLALALVCEIKDKVIYDKKYLVNYEAFAIHLKKALLPEGHYAENQVISYESLFLLYLVKPRQIVEACLLAVDYKKRLGE